MTRGLEKILEELLTEKSSRNKAKIQLLATNQEAFLAWESV